MKITDLDPEGQIYKDNLQFFYIKIAEACLWPISNLKPSTDSKGVARNLAGGGGPRPSREGPPQKKTLNIFMNFWAPSNAKCLFKKMVFFTNNNNFRVAFFWRQFTIQYSELLGKKTEKNDTMDSYSKAPRYNEIVLNSSLIQWTHSEHLLDTMIS